MNRQWKIATATPRNDGLDRLFHPSIYMGKMDGPPPSPKRVSAGLPRRVLDVSMREFSYLFAGYKNVTHDVEGCIYAECSGSVGVIISILSSVMGALMVETPQSVPTAPSMHKHTMRVVLVIMELCLETIYDNAFLQSLGRCLLYAYNALG